MLSRLQRRSSIRCPSKETLLDYTILDSAGNALASFADDELAARATLHAMVRVEPDAADHVVLLAYDDEGLPVGSALTFYDCPPPVTVEPSPVASVVQRWLTDAFLHRVRPSQARYVAASEPIVRSAA